MTDAISQPLQLSNQLAAIVAPDEADAAVRFGADLYVTGEQFGRPVPVRLTVDVRAAAQAPPGRSRRGRHDQPLPQLRLARRVCQVPLAGAAEQAPVHTPRISSRPPFG